MTPNLFALNTNTILTISFFRSFKKCKSMILWGIYIYVTKSICCQEQKMGEIICPSHIRGHSITTWTIWGGGRGSKNVCSCPRSGYKNCPHRGGKKWQNSVHVVHNGGNDSYIRQLQLWDQIICQTNTAKNFLWNWLVILMPCNSLTNFEYEEVFA